MRSTSFEHWLGRQNHAIADAITKVKTSNQEINVFYHIFYKPDKTPIPVSYYVKRLTSSSSNTEIQHITKNLNTSRRSLSSNPNSRRSSKTRRASVTTKSLENVEMSSAPYGILLVITPIVPNKIMLDQLAWYTL